MLIQGSIVVITGAARGIGRALALRFAREGAAGLVVSDRDEAALASVAEEAGAMAVAADVSREAGVRALVDATISRHGRIDLFCSNAGILVEGGPEVPDEDWERIHRVNVLSHVYASRALLPHFLERGQGYFLQTVSAAGLLTAPALDDTFGIPKNGFWTTGTARTVSSLNSLHWGRNGGPNGYSRGSNATSGAATSPAVTMPASGSLPVTFRVWRQVEHQRTGFDVLTLTVLGTSNTQLWQVASVASGSPMVGAWTLVSATVPAAYNGQSVQFRFDFTTVDGTNNNFEGVYIDDFRFPC